MTRARVVSLLLALVAVPAALSISVFLMDAPITVGERSPRTVVAPDLIRVTDEAATARARAAAAESAAAVYVDDPTARSAVVAGVRQAFAAVRELREPEPAGRPPTAERPSDVDRSPAADDARVETLAARLPGVSARGLRLLLDTPAAELNDLAGETVSIAQQLARQRITAEDLDAVADQQLRTEIAVRSLPEDVASFVVAPIVSQALRPTVSLDEQATLDARRQAAGEVAEVVRSFPRGSVIVSAGERVSEADFAALSERGLEGASPLREVVKALFVALLCAAATGFYLRVYRPQVWRTPGRLLLLAVLFTGFALVVEAVTLLAPETASSWRYLVPAGALAMLATILFDPPIGLLTAIPTTVLVAFEAPGESGAIAFSALATLAAVPFVSRLSSRTDLRSAALRSTVVYVVLAGICAAVFDDLGSLQLALLVGLLNGVLSAMLVLTALPFLESAFGAVTATSLLDLADRNHPLLRELEQKALGSYNHSIMVAMLVERACRAIGADALLGSTAALYHDIGKVRRPYFFVENQIGIPNPHDDLEPAVSAVIIQEHVSDGITMARTFKLPPEIVEGIATHHGNTLVTFFHRKALAHAVAGEQVDEGHYRYKGRRPSTREMAVLMLADCCEAAARSAAQRDRNLSRADLEGLVHALVAERVDDGQLDDSALTFRDLRAVTESFIEALAGVYHPRIAYPDPIAPPSPAALEAPEP